MRLITKKLVSLLVLAAPLLMLATSPAMSQAGSPAAPGASAYEVTINETGKKLELTCKGGDVVINGEKNRVRVRGAVSTILINGDGNLITLDARVREIVINGADNRVLYVASQSPRPPEVTSNGSGNVVEPTR